MATKNLARTITERGRTASNKLDRRESNRRSRYSAREFARKVILDIEVSDDFIVHERDRIYTELTDKLGAFNRWVESQVGQHFDDVYSKVVQRWSWDSLQGLHVLRSHFMPLAHLPHDGIIPYYYDVYVDHNGYFVKNSKVDKNIYTPHRFNKDRKIYDFYGPARVVGMVNNRFCWFEKTRETWCTCKSYGCSRLLFMTTKSSGSIYGKNHIIYGRQAKFLTDEEKGVYLSFSDYIRGQHLSQAPLVENGTRVRK